MDYNIRMDIGRFKEEKPHLRDILRLYEKILEFRRFVADIEKSPISIGDVVYPPELIDQIFGGFSSILNIPEDNLSPLKEAMEFGNIDLTKLPLNEIPPFSLPHHEDELAGFLFLISKPYFLWLKDSYNADTIFWQEGRCPVCNSTPSIAFFDKDGNRKLYCSFCENTGHYNRLGCPVCLNRDSSKIDIIELEGENGFRIDACNACGSYIKTVTACLDDLIPDLADIVSLPLDIVAQEKGYRRNSPNPIGMVRMV